MSGNPNPTVCANCRTENPPNAEYCRECGAALTLVAEQALLERDTAESQDPLFDTPAPADPDLGADGTNLSPPTASDPSRDRFSTD
jgi:hypothetical protein